MTLKSKLKSVFYLMAQRPLPLEKPIVIQFPVIDICNSQCQMCRIWENHKSNDITPEDLRKGLSNPLYSEVRSVGLNGGEPTLRKDLGELAQVLYDTLPWLKTIARITNVGEVVNDCAPTESVFSVARALCTLDLNKDVPTCAF